MTTSTTTGTPPVGIGAKVRQIGPGLLAAATGVGAGDLVATMIAGAEYGTLLLWAAVLGTVLKLALAEGVGRWHLASGGTLLDGWRRLGYWATVFFGIYYLLWLTIPPMGLLFIDKPFAVTLVYGVLGAAFMPFLGGTLLLLLNSRRIAADGRSGWVSNLLLTAASALFVVLLAVDMVERFG